jgi:hypothetical protein
MPYMSVPWGFVEKAAEVTNNMYFDLLHLFTVLASQDLEGNLKKGTRGVGLHISRTCAEKKVEELCSRSFLWWEDEPSQAFKDKFVIVVKELERYQVHKGRISLRGDPGEEHIVRGLWQMAQW